MTATLCPVFQDSQFTSNNEFLSGGLLWFYEAGSSTLATAYTTNAGGVAWSNPIVLDSRGETGGTIWLDPALSYRIVLESRPYYGQTHGVVITEHDDITGVPVAVYAEEWVPFAGAPTYISTSSFTVEGDFRDVFVADRKLLITSASVETIHSVISSSFGSGVTTVNVTGSINSNIATVAYSFITPDASPNRFENVTVTNDLTVSGDTVLDGNVAVGGNATITGNLNSIPIANWWNNTNNAPHFGAGTGYQKFNNGLLVQWGTAGTGTTASVISLNTAFASTNYTVVCCASEGPGDVNAVISSTGKTASSFTVYTYNSASAGVGTYISYVAIGQAP